MKLALVALMLSCAPGFATDPVPAPRREVAGFLFFGKKGGDRVSLVEEGMKRYAAGDCAGATTNLEAARAFEAEKVTPWVQNVLYHAFLSCGQSEKAQAVAEEIARNAPQESLSYLQLGVAELWNRKYKPAIENFKKALEFDGASPRTHFYKGMAHGYLGDATAKEKEFGEAERKYELILARNPKDFTAHFELASLYLYWNKQTAKASRHVASARENLPTASADELGDEKRVMGQFHMPLLEGILLYRAGENQEAADRLRDTLAKAPSGARAELAELFYYLGKSLQNLGETEKAKVALAKVGELDPSGPYAYDAQKGMKKTK